MITFLIEIGEKRSSIVDHERRIVKVEQRTFHKEATQLELRVSDYIRDALRVSDRIIAHECGNQTVVRCDTGEIPENIKIALENEIHNRIGKYEP